MSKVSVALVGDSWFLCGPPGNNMCGAATPEFEAQFSHCHNPNAHHTYVALGEDNSYYMRFYDTVTKQTHSTSFLGSYPGLAAYIRNEAEGDPICVSLGEDGHYFFRDAGGSSWRLPKTIIEHVGLDDDTDDPVYKLWLGKDDSYYAQTKFGSCRWNLKGMYGSLDETIKYDSAGVRCLGLNMHDDSSYFALFKDMKLVCNPGRTACSGGGLTKAKYDMWIDRLVQISR